MAASPQGKLTFIGTATVLIEVGDITLLTDPNFLHRGERAYVGMGVSTKRLTEPAMGISDLPRLDAVVLSHHHGDHFDRRAAAGLDPDLPIVTEQHAARKLGSQGFRGAVALQPWEKWQLPARSSGAAQEVTLSVRSTPGRHAPGLLQKVVPPVMGSVLEFGNAAGSLMSRMYITGDTLLDPCLDEIGVRYPEIDLCLVHLGGTRLAGVKLTMDGADGVEMLRRVKPKRAVPIHYDDYTLFKSPLDDFRRRMEGAGIGTEVTYLDRGDSMGIPL